MIIIGAFSCLMGDDEFKSQTAVVEFEGELSANNFKSDETIAVRFFNIFKIVPELHYFIYIVLLLENYLFNSFLFVKICCDTL